MLGLGSQTVRPMQVRIFQVGMTAQERPPQGARDGHKHQTNDRRGDHMRKIAELHQEKRQFAFLMVRPALVTLILTVTGQTAVSKEPTARVCLGQ